MSKYTEVPIAERLQQVLIRAIGRDELKLPVTVVALTPGGTAAVVRFDPVQSTCHGIDGIEQHWLCGYLHGEFEAPIFCLAVDAGCYYTVYCLLDEEVATLASSLRRRPRQ